MRKRVNVLLACGVVAALQSLLAIAAPAESQEGEPGARSTQQGEDRWVPSLAITGGAIFQNQDGFADSVTEQPPGSAPVPLRGPVNGNDLVIGPFVGGALELMTPALPIPTRPRLFLSGEILPTFASDRNLVVEGDPDCVRGPEPDAPCARDEDGSRRNDFGENGANGEGSKTTAQLGTLAYGASLGAAFPVGLGERQLRIKPSIGWINYKVEATGLVVDATCNPSSRCTNTTSVGGVMRQGFLRETILEANDSRRFNAIGGGLDVEVDTGRFGPIGISLFLGGRAYRTLGNRTISFGAEASYPAIPVPAPPPTVGPVPAADSAARFEVKVDPWMYRAHVGIRLQWLGGLD